MTGGHTIRAIGPEPEGDDAHRAADAATEEYGTAESEDSYEPEEELWEEEAGAGRATRSEWIWPALALIAIGCWTVFFGWTYREEMLAGASAQDWIRWAGDWALPVLLVIGIWLIAMRTSRREASRFADAAHALSAESALLEERLVTVNRELSLAREFLSSETRELETLGRVAGTRITEHAESLQSLIGQNHDQVERIGTISENALANMDRLRDELPVIANSARDTSNQIGAAGEGASEQLERLVTGFERLNVFGQASEQQVASLSERIDAALAAFEAQAAHMGDVTEQRFAALRQASEEYRGELDSREVAGLAAMRRRMDSLGEELAASSAELDRAETAAIDSLKERLAGLSDESASLSAGLRATEQQAGDSWSRQVDALRERLGQAVEEIQALDGQALENAQAKLAELRAEAERVDAAMADRDAAFGSRVSARREEIEGAEAASLTALEDRFAAFDAGLAHRKDQQAEYAETIQERTEATLAKLAELAGQSEELAARAENAQQRLTASSETMAARMAGAREDSEVLQPAIEELTEASVRLLELIQAGANHSRETLPSSLEEAETRLTAAREAGEELQALLGETGSRSRSVSDYVILAREETEKVDANLDGLGSRLDGLRQTFANEVEALRVSLAALEDDTDAVGEKASTTLRASIDDLDRKAREALSLTDTETEKRLGLLADTIGEKTAGAIDAALTQQSSRSIADLDAAAAKAAEAARQAAMQLRDQLALVNELAGNLENRVALARERAEEQVDNDFARRVALITEALNSNAIDIAKSLSSDVTDTAWASYLRGDRGIFTRRAVSLIGNTEARKVAELYDTDPDFADHVSRYIHDFEAMLRTMLSTRDGNALGVTLLSSDMGKLYVALAQAIERLRSD
ncbi:ATPase [Erythrobacteraceae bacterium WH01K]|nr:ATPase [Erythrobacteraceae bacterium WH01K]